MSSTTFGLATLRRDVGELLAKHERKADITDYAKYADEPIAFLEEVLGCHGWEKQNEMLRLVRDNRRVVAVTGNGIGKDWLTARMALWWVYARRGFVVLTGPTSRQVKEILMRQVRRAFLAAPELPGELYSMELRVDGLPGDEDESAILAFTAEIGDKLQGIHHPRLLICITEAQAIDDEVWAAAIKCATGGNNHIFAYGNPTRGKGAFRDAAHDPAQWECITVRSDEHPNVISGREEYEGAATRVWIKEQEATYGKDSPAYCSNVLAQFPTEGSFDALVKRAWLEEAFKRHNNEAEAAAAKWRRPVFGVDVARYGQDKSCIAVMQGGYLVELIPWSNASTTLSAANVIEHKQRYSYRIRRGAEVVEPTICVDDAGVGGGVTDELIRRNQDVIAFNGAHSARDGEKFCNARAEYYWHFRCMLEAGRLALPNDAQMVEEFLATDYFLNNQGRIQIISKDDIRKELKRSPDKADAITMATWHAVEAPGSVTHFTFLA